MDVCCRTLAVCITQQTIIIRVRSSNPVGGEFFRTCQDQCWGPPSLLYDGYRVCVPGQKRLGRSVDHPPPSNAEVKERVELCVYLSLGIHAACSKVTLPLVYLKVIAGFPCKIGVCHCSVETLVRKQYSGH